MCCKYWPRYTHFPDQVAAGSDGEALPRASGAKSSISSNSALPMLHGSVHTRARRLDAGPRGGQEIPSRVTLSLKKGWYIFNWSLQGHVGGSLELIDRNPCRPCQVTKNARGDVANGANQQPSGTPVLTTYQPDTNARISFWQINCILCPSKVLFPADAPFIYHYPASCLRFEQILEPDIMHKIEINQSMMRKFLNGFNIVLEFIFNVRTAFLSE